MPLDDFRSLLVALQEMGQPVINGSNPPLYPEWPAYFRKHQPPTLVVWGKNDAIFPAEGAHPYKRDLKDVEFHLLDTGHFALNEDGTTIAGLIRDFLSKREIGKLRL